MPATEIDLKAIVADAVKATPEVEKAVRRIVNRLARDAEAQEAWNEETATVAVRALVHERRALNRTATVNAAWLNADVAKGMEAPAMRSMLDEYTVGDKRLGDCVKPDLDYAKARADAGAMGLRVKGLFLSKVSALLSDDETKVRSVLTDERVVKLHREAEGAIK